MQRRNFIKATSFSAIAISAPGFIRFNGQSYVGDCETTSDILGPFYRPDSPERSSLVIKGEKGDPIELVGKILHDDCSTPYSRAKIELWHCDANGVYDNESPDYKYRGTTYSDRQGNYSFKTILPVPYDIGGGNFRPAHFHMMISAEGYQPLVTQLYFTGDPWLAGDSSASSPSAVKRILEVKDQKGKGKKVEYNISMSTKRDADPAAIDRLVGVYVDEKDATKKTELIKKDNQLWIKGDDPNGMPFGMNFQYEGQNTFSFSGVPAATLYFVFEIMPAGVVKLTETYTDDKGEKTITVSVREK